MSSVSQVPPSRTRLAWFIALIVGIASFAWFAYDRKLELFALDESSYIAQARAFDLLIDGRLNDISWLEAAALDQPPLFKYLVGLSLRIGGYPREGRDAAMDWQKRFNFRAVGDEDYFFVNSDNLNAARWPAIILGTIGCVVLFWLGVLLRDIRTGTLAAFLLAINPLYRQQTRHALNDVPCEALLLASAALALWAWRKRLFDRFLPTIWAWLVGGLLGGLAVLAKLTGLIILIHLAAWSALALLLTSTPVKKRGTVVIGAIVFASTLAFTVLLGNPTLTAHPPGPLTPEMQAVADKGPIGRGWEMVQFRMRISALQQKFYPLYALSSLPQKLAITARQGFGRFSPFGPAHSNLPKIYDWSQDRAVLLWLPWVAIGAFIAAKQGRDQKRNQQPPMAWAILLAWAITLICVVGYLPMAWDRYLLSIQPWNSLLAALVVVVPLDILISKFRRPKPVEDA